jgi:hypothetical protein
LPSTLSPKSGFASNHVCASFGVKKLLQVANVPSWIPAVSVAGGKVVVVIVVVVAVVSASAALEKRILS